MRFWRNTDLATLPLLSPPETLGTSVLGYEWDEDLDNGFRPRGVIRLSSTTADVNGLLLDYGSSYGPGPATHHLTLYRHNSGALVFGAGTVQWSWGLDATHDNNAGAPTSGPDVRMQQATVNLFADMSVQPASLQPPLVSTSASVDTQAPTSQITSPSSGATVQRGSAVTIAGTASDTGGVVGGVEVSVDGGTSWHPATGRESWSYSWVPTVLGQATIRSAAVDDSGNLESPGAAITVQVVPSSGPTRIWSDAVVPAITSANDSNPVELGVKFISDVTGSVTGLHFYKGNGNTGPHFGHLWLGDGTLLGTATFANETASGWQQANFPSPVPINANTTYVVSYHTDIGHYAFNSGYFANSGVDSPPLHALRDGIDGGNGVYAYGGSGFPLFSYQSANYWVDVDFTPSSTTTGHTTIWANTVVPSLISADDPNAVELGVKFRTDVGGSITSLRFYKGSTNTGTHVAHLWNSNGSLIATATFANETATGWQQVDFPSAVPINANTTYVASYHTDVGHYSANVGYFANSGVDSPPLYALRDGTDGPNGIYRYGPSAFPTQTYQSTNYWVDVVFKQNALSGAVSGAAPSAAVSSANPKQEDAKPRKPSILKYPRSAWRTTGDEAWNPLQPGARGGLLNGGKEISEEGE
jgi:hypothetical protein